MEAVRPSTRSLRSLAQDEVLFCSNHCRLLLSEGRKARVEGRTTRMQPRPALKLGRLYPTCGELAGERAFEAVERRVVAAFGAGDQYGLRIGGAEQPPAVLGLDAHAVDV